MNDVNGFGAKILFVAVQTFPLGFTVKQFSDDQEPFTIGDTESGGYKMLYDGSLFPYTKASPVPLSVSVIPNSEDDLNLKILLQTRSINLNILPIEDFLTAIVTYPDGGKIILTNGTILSGPLGDSITTSARRKGNKYNFMFGTFAGLQSATEIAATIVSNGLSIL